ncbi:MAG: oligosaccharide flippase family protein [Gammaproteobacteria bacterium]|nr:oligosaccharide flippase family protein [Gammaproteobacteria bacterium]
MSISDVKKGVKSAVILGIIAKLVAFLAQYTIIKWLGTQDYGLLVYTLSIIGFLVLFSQLGMHNSLLKLMPEYMAHNAWEKLSTLLLFVGSITLLSSVFVFIVFESTLYWFLDVKNKEILMLAGLLILIQPAYNLLNIILQAVRQVALFRFFEEIYLPLLLLLGVLFLGFLAMAHLENIFYLRILIVLIGSFVLVYKVRQYLSESLNFKVLDKTIIKNVFSMSFAMFYISMLTFLESKVSILLLGNLETIESVGIFNILSLLSQLALFGLASVNMVVAPLISSLFSQKKMSELQDVISIAVIVSGLFSLLTFLFFLLLGTLVIDLFGINGNEFYLPLILLLLGTVISGCFGPAGYILIMTGHLKQSLKMKWVLIIFTLMSNYLLINLFGLNGAVMATALSMALWNIMAFIVVKKETGLNTFVISHNVFKMGMPEIKHTLNLFRKKKSSTDDIN